MTNSVENPQATPVCVTAFVAPQSAISLAPYAADTAAPAIITVGVYMSNRTIARICNFTNAANALKYAFILKADNCPISKSAFALLTAEIKRTGAVSTRAQMRAKAKAAAEPQPAAESVQYSDNGTPVYKQYAALKKKHPDAILLFRMGDFYEAFADDAAIASEVLGLTLTERAGGRKKIKLAGFPHHALDNYLPKLVRAGHRVAICEQLDK